MRCDSAAKVEVSTKKGQQPESSAHALFTRSVHPSSFSESVVEDATLDWFAELGYTIAHGPDLAPEGSAAERASYGDMVLVDRLQAALARINTRRWAAR